MYIIIIKITNIFSNLFFVTSLRGTTQPLLITFDEENYELTDLQQASFSLICIV